MQRGASWANAVRGMETILILGALVALLFCGLTVASVLARGRRPELRMAREAELLDDEDDEEFLIRSLEPPAASPIDRKAPLIEVEPSQPSPPDRLPEPRFLPHQQAPDPQKTRRRNPHGEER